MIGNRVILYVLYNIANMYLQSTNALTTHKPEQYIANVPMDTVLSVSVRWLLDTFCV